jgi:hypothetical protein
MNEISEDPGCTGPVTPARQCRAAAFIEAEQQLLGAILTNNEVYDRVAG